MEIVPLVFLMFVGMVVLFLVYDYWDDKQDGKPDRKRGQKEADATGFSIVFFLFIIIMTIVILVKL